MKGEQLFGALQTLEEEIFDPEYVLRIRNFREERDVLLREINKARRKGAKPLTTLPRRKMIELMQKHNLITTEGEKSK